MDYEYQVSKVFINVYLPGQANFEAHFSKNLQFFDAREQYGQVVLVDLFLKNHPCYSLSLKKNEQN